MSRNGVLVLALLTLVGFGGAGLALMYFFHEDFFSSLFPFPDNALIQLATGVIYGIVSGLLLWKLVSMPYFTRTRHFFSRLIGSIDLRVYDILFISFCAGVGEELLFRGAIQPWLGVWLTSVIFVAVHGYLTPANIPLTVYGLVMVVVIAGIGYLTNTVGLYAAMIAHTIIDIILFFALRKTAIRLAADEVEEPLIE